MNRKAPLSYPNELRHIIESLSVEMVEVCHLLYSRGYICGTEGNCSVRINKDYLLTTPAGICKGRVKAEDLVLTDLRGNSLDGKRPSTELSMHLSVYKARQDAKAIVHAHPTMAVAFSIAGKTIDTKILPEIVCTLGDIPTAPYATPSTPEMGQSLEAAIANRDAIVLDHHGAIAVGNDLFQAFYKMEAIEHQAQTLFYAELMGGAKPLSATQIDGLMKIRSVYL